MRLSAIARLIGTALAVTICSFAIATENAAQLVSLQTLPVFASNKLPSSGPLKFIIDDLRQHATGDQYQLITKAIIASPALTTQLTTLAENGLITKFSIDMPPSQSMHPNIFGAGISGTTWAFTSSFLNEQATVRIFDVVGKDDILPNNMVFALGHLAFHTQKEEQFKTDEEALKRVTDSNDVLDGVKRKDLIGPMGRLVDLRLRYEAGAFIQGWNDVYDAAVLENNGNPLSANQVGNLMLNLRNRAVFLKAMNDHKLFSDSGRIEQTTDNVNAIVSALHDSKIIDIE
jgi:hypothetical protein